MHAGVDFLWALALEADQGKVAQEAASTIVQLNLQLSPQLMQDQASVRAATIECVLAVFVFQSCICNA